VIRLGVVTPSQTQIPPLELPRYGGGRQGRYSLYRHSPQAGTPQQVRTHSKGYWAKTESSWRPTKARGIANRPNIKKLKTLVVSLFCHKASEYNRLKYLKPELGLWLSLAKLIRL